MARPPSAPLFLVKITAKSGTGDSAIYQASEAWREGGAFGVKTAGRYAGPDSLAYPVPGASFTVGQYALARLSDGGAGLNYELVQGAGSGVAAPDDPEPDSVPALTADGDLVNTPQYVTPGTNTVTQYVVPNVGDDPTTSPIRQLVVDNTGTPTVTLATYTDGTAGGAGVTETLTPTLYSVSYVIGGASGGYTVAQTGGALTVAYTAGTVVDFSAATVTGLTIGGGVPTYTKYTKTYADFAAAAPSKTINLFAMATGSVVLSVVAKHSVSFSGGSVSAATLNVGITSVGAQFLSTFDVHQAVSGTAKASSTSPGYSDFTGATQVTATLSTTGGNTNTLTQGSVDIWVLYAPLP